MSASLPPLQENATADLAAFASRLRFEAIPAEVVERVKLCVLDGIGVCLFGATLPWTRYVQDMVRHEGANPAADFLADADRRFGRGAALAGSPGFARHMEMVRQG